MSRSIRPRWVVVIGLLLIVADACLLYRNLTKAMGG